MKLHFTATLLKVQEEISFFYTQIAKSDFTVIMKAKGLFNKGFV